MDRLGLKSRAVNVQRIGEFTKERESKEQYRPLKICLESEEIKIQVLNNLTKLKGLFIKVTEDLTKQERLLVKEWKQKAQERNEREQNKLYKWRVRRSPQSWLYLKQVLCKNYFK